MTIQENWKINIHNNRGAYNSSETLETKIPR